MLIDAVFVQASATAASKATGRIIHDHLLEHIPRHLGRRIPLVEYDEAAPIAPFSLPAL